MNLNPSIKKIQIIKEYTKKNINNYSLVTIKSNAKAANSSPKNIKRIIALKRVSGMLNKK